MKKRIIGILTNILATQDNPERIYVNRGYVTSITRAGAIPLLIPVLDDMQAIRQIIEEVDGLLFSGGQDIHPHYYKEAPGPGLGEVCLERDISEMEALYYAISLKKPLLGICRGMQLLNVGFGGTLIQDIPREVTTALEHRQTAKREEGTHEVEVVTGTRLHDIFGQKSVLTNSFHHQAVKEMAPGFIPTAYTADGVIEAMESTGNHCMWGVQWHPEAMAVSSPLMQKLFDAFIAEVS